MAKEKTSFFCKECGWEYAKWQGKCDGCKEWNTISESPKKNLNEKIPKSVPMAGGERKKATVATDIEAAEYPGFKTEIGELDRVLGGKMVHGSVTLIAGEPGKGKSTLLLQTAGNVSRNVGPVLYCSGEESELQIKNRAVRLNQNLENLHLYNTEDIFEIADAIEEIKPVFVIIDSIQHLRNPTISGDLGSVKQIKDCGANLVRIAKQTGVSIFIVGHVTKDDSIAGPRTLEHMVDTVLFLEGDKTSDLRLLRSQKNRFGSDTELGVFRMEGKGMMEIKNPSEYLISNRASDSSGSTIVCIAGVRPMLVEVQALVSPTSYENAIPRRTSRGLNRDRFNILIAVLEKRCGLPLGTKDIYLNVAGGMALEEPAADLGVALSIASSSEDVIVDPFTLVIGEVGLAGEIRPVKDIERLIKEADKNGFKRFVLPERNLDAAKLVSGNLELIPVSKLAQAIKLLIKKK